MMEKPAGKAHEARWLEVPDAALLLEAARTYKVPDGGTPFAYPLLATFLLTGGRETEVYGLELDDVSFERKTITFRPNDWRRLKTRGSNRVVALLPQLEEILRAYLRGPDRPAGDLLFPSFATGREAILTDTRKLMDHVAARAGWKSGEIRTKMFRHTYCAARLQTLDGGAPVSLFTVSRELGHTSPAMVQHVYGHLGAVRHRSEVVEYRIEQHRKALAKRLEALPEGA
jgi:integrase